LDRTGKKAAENYQLLATINANLSAERSHQFLHGFKMPSLNRIQLISRLEKEPEVRFTPNGKEVCTFSLAVSRRWKSSAGED
jgi:hypothetical protein